MEKILLISFSLFITFSATVGCCQESTITTSGTGKVSSLPDTLYFKIILSTNQSGLLEEVISNLTQMRQFYTQILTKYGVQKQDITPGRVTLIPDIGEQYRESTQSYTPTQTIFVKIRNISANPMAIDQLFDELNGSNKLFRGVTDVYLDIQNQEPLEDKAIYLAYEDAQAKAHQQTEVSNRKLGDPLLITEGSIFKSDLLRKWIFNVNNYFYNNTGSRLTEVRTGQMEIQVDIVVVWKLI